MPLQPLRLPAALSAAVLALASCAATATAPERPADTAAPPAAAPIRTADVQADFQAWLEGVRTEALQLGISRKVVETALTGIAPVPQILERDRAQPEFKLTFDTYLNRIVTPENVARGQQMLAKHKAVLEQVSRRYGVSPRAIIGIWGIETRYGAVKAQTPVIPALATLAFDARRPQFFRNELFAALRILDKGYITLPELKGSWAGAMGQPQFMPSSYLAYAEDFDGDGRRDIWRSEADVFASIANYLARHGWTDGQTWGREVRLPEGFAQRLPELARSGKSGCRAIDGMTVDRPLDEWQRAGVRRVNGADLPKADLAAAVALPDGPGGRAFLVYRNYQSVLRYNCAHHYALTVGTLADRIGER